MLGGLRMGLIWEILEFCVILAFCILSGDFAASVIQEQKPKKLLWSVACIPLCGVVFYLIPWVSIGICVAGIYLLMWLVYGLMWRKQWRKLFFVVNLFAMNILCYRVIGTSILALVCNQD